VLTQLDTGIFVTLSVNEITWSEGTIIHADALEITGNVSVGTGSGNIPAFD